MAILTPQELRSMVRRKDPPAEIMAAVLNNCTEITTREMPLSGFSDYPAALRPVLNRIRYYQEGANAFRELKQTVAGTYPEGGDKTRLLSLLDTALSRYTELRRRYDEKNFLPFRLYDGDEAEEPCGEGEAWLTSGAQAPQIPDREKKLELLRYDAGIARKQTERDAAAMMPALDQAAFVPDDPPSIWRCNHYKWLYWVIALGISLAHFVVADLSRGHHAQESNILLAVLFVRIVVMIFRPLDIRIYKVAQFLGVPIALMSLTLPWYREFRILIIIALLIFVPLLGFCPLERWVFVKLTKKNDPKWVSLQQDYAAETERKRAEYQASLPEAVGLSEYDSAIRLLQEQKAALDK